MFVKSNKTYLFEDVSSSMSENFLSSVHIIPNSWFYWNRTTRKSLGKPVSNLQQGTCSIPFSYSENSLLFCELHQKVCWQFKSASTVISALQPVTFGSQSVANPLSWTHLWAVIHTSSVLKRNVTKRTTDTKDQERLESTSGGHNQYITVKW